MNQQPRSTRWIQVLAVAASIATILSLLLSVVLFVLPNLKHSNSTSNSNSYPTPAPGYRATDRWYDMAAPKVGDSFFNSVAATDLGTAWAVGEIRSPTAHYSTLIESWDGKRWTVVASPSDPRADTGLSAVAVAPTGNGTMWAVGHDGKQALVLRMSFLGSIVPFHNVGVAANEVDLQTVAVFNEEAWVAGSYTTNGQRYAVIARGGYDGHFQIEYDGASAGQQGCVISRVIAISQANLWAAGWCGNGNDTRAVVLHSDGRSWSASASFAQALRGQRRMAGKGPQALAAYADSSNSVWIGGGYCPATCDEAPFLAHWDGQSWTFSYPELTFPGSLFVGDLYATSPANVYLAGSYLTGAGSSTYVILHFDGAQWQRLATPAQGNAVNSLTSIANVVGQGLIAVGGTSDPPPATTFTDLPLAITTIGPGL